MGPRIFICHASEDKTLVAEPLVNKLKEHGVKLWYDESNIEFGDDINAVIKNGLKESRYGVVILSQDFFKKSYPQMELNTLLGKEKFGRKVVLPILHNIEINEVREKLPIISEKSYLSTEIISGQVVNLDNIVKKVIRVLLRTIDNENNDYSLIEIYERCRTSDSSSLVLLGELLDKFYRIKNIDYDMTVVRAKIIVDYVLKEVYQRTSENDSINDQVNIFDACCSKGILSKNVETYCKVVQNFFQIIIGKSFVEFITNEDLELCLKSLRGILNWYINTYGKVKISCKNELLIVWPEDFTIDDIKQSYDIETKLFHQELISPIDVAIRWAEHNPYINIGVRDSITKRLAGFFCVLPITDSLFDIIASGDYIDTHIPISEIRQYEPPDFYKLYLCSFCIDPDYQNTKAFKLLSNAFVNLLLRFADREIFVSEMIADAITDKGEKLCKHVNMKPINISNHGSKIYKTTLLPPSLRIVSDNGKKLISFYTELYNMYKDVL